MNVMKIYTTDLSEALSEAMFSVDYAKEEFDVANVSSLHPILILKKH